MKDFHIMTVKNFSHAQNCRNWKDVENFMFFDFFFLPFTCIMVASTNSLIIVGAYLTKKTNWCHCLMIMINHYGANATNVNLSYLYKKKIN